MLRFSLSSLPQRCCFSWSLSSLHLGVFLGLPNPSFKMGTQVSGKGGRRAGKRSEVWYLLGAGGL